MILRLLSYLKPFRRKFLLAFAILMLGTLAEVTIPFSISFYIDHYVTQRTIPTSVLFYFALFYLSLILISTGCQYYQSLSFQLVAQGVISRLRADVFAKLQRLGLSFFDRTPVGSLVSTVTNDTEAVKDLYISVLSSFLQNIFFILSVFVAMFILDVRMAGYSLAMLPIIIALMFTYRALSGKTYYYSRRVLGQINATLNEAIQGVNIIQAFQQQRRLALQFATVNRKYYQAMVKNIRFYGLLLRPATQLLSLFAVLAVLVFFGTKSFVGGVKIGVIYAFISYSGQIFEPINQIMNRLSQMQQSVVAAQKVFTLIDEPQSTPRYVGEGAKIEAGMIQFRDVSFGYDSEHMVLKNITFDVLPGQTVAIVGQTGSGKSSIVNLLMRFYPLHEGEILIDGTPLSHITEQELRQNIGLVLQDPFLFYGDVKTNISLGLTNIKMHEIERVAGFVRADRFIERLPHGYDEQVSERGSSFSSGERQLLSLARTMLRNPRILLLDEATANIDSATEEAIQVALKRMRAGRTTICIAHRLSTIQDADLILVLRRGEIVEQGTHQQLLAQRGLYYKMYLFDEESG